jgi:hypothetical protein
VVKLTGTAVPNDTPLSSASARVTGACTYLGDRYKCTFTPGSAGRHKLAVRVKGRHTRGSPFTVEVSPGAAAGATSAASGQGLYSARAGEPSRFTVQVTGNR